MTLNTASGLTAANRAVFDSDLRFSRNEFALGYDGEIAGIAATYVFLAVAAAALLTGLLAWPGLRKGALVLTGIGLGLMAGIWTGLALLGLDVIFPAVPWAYLTLKLIGAAYLIYLAYAIWRDARRPLAARHRFGCGRQGRQLR